MNGVKFRIIVILVVFILAIFFIFLKAISEKSFLEYAKNYSEKITTAFKIEKIKNLKIGEVDESQANFVLYNFKELKNRGDLKNITRDDLKKIKIRDAKVSDLPAIVEIHNKGLQKGVWCDLPYETSAWTVIKEYQNWTRKYGKENIYIRVAEIDGEIAAVMAGADYQDKAVNLFTFMNVDVPRKIWSETMIKIATNFFELARSLNLDVVETRIAKGVWLEGFMRDVIKAESLPEGVWHIDRDFNLSRSWTEEDYSYDNDLLSKRENQNNKTEKYFYEQPLAEKDANILSQTEFSDTYKRIDGAREILIYPSPVNIKIDGKWIKIDDYLKKSEEIQETELDAGKQYQLNPFDVYVGADDSRENVLFYKKNDDLISFSLENIRYKDGEREVVLAETKLGNISSSYKSILFRDIFEGADLKYHSTRSGIKEELIFNNSEIFKKVKEPNYFGGKIILRTKISVSQGVIPELHNSQIYFKKEKDGKKIFSTSQPFVYDQKKRTSIVESELKKEGEYYYLEITMDYGWMTSEEKNYPLILDPNIDMNPAEDVSLCADSLCNTDVRDSPLNVGIGKVFIKFNISGIPAGAVIQSANVILNHSSANFVNQVTARRFIDQVWTESSAIGTFTGTNYGNILSTVTTAIGNATQTWDVTGSAADGFKKDYNDRNTFFTVLLNSTTASPAYTYVNNGTGLILYYSWDKNATPKDTYDIYHSSEGTAPPVLRVTYTVDPICGDGACNGSETHATCPADCPLIVNDTSSTVFDYVNHPLEAKSILNSPGAGMVQFRKQ